MPRSIFCIRACRMRYRFQHLGFYPVPSLTRFEEEMALGDSDLGWCRENSSELGHGPINLWDFGRLSTLRNSFETVIRTLDSRRVSAARCDLVPVSAKKVESRR